MCVRICLHSYLRRPFSKSITIARDDHSFNGFCIRRIPRFPPAAFAILRTNEILRNEHLVSISSPVSVFLRNLPFVSHSHPHLLLLLRSAARLPLPPWFDRCIRHKFSSLFTGRLGFGLWIDCSNCIHPIFESKSCEKFPLNVSRRLLRYPQCLVRSFVIIWNRNTNLHSNSVGLITFESSSYWFKALFFHSFWNIQDYLESL